MHVCGTTLVEKLHECSLMVSSELTRPLLGSQGRKKATAEYARLICQVAAVRVLSVVDKQRSHRRRREVQGAAGGHMGATWTSGWATGGGWSQDDDREMS